MLETFTHLPELEEALAHGATDNRNREILIDYGEAWRADE